MTQEYLILSKEELENIKQYKPSSVSVSFDKIEDSDCWVVSYSKPDDNMSIAEELSLVNDYIVNHFHVTILSSPVLHYWYNCNVSVDSKPYQAMEG